MTDCSLPFGSMTGSGGGGNRTREGFPQERLVYVYFVRCGQSGPIKIGIATDLGTRLRMLQVGNHKPLTLHSYSKYPKPLAKRIEKLLHGRLCEHNISGEWFRPHPDVLAAASNPRSFVADGLDAQDRNAHVFGGVA